MAHFGVLKLNNVRKAKCFWNTILRTQYMSTQSIRNIIPLQYDKDPGQLFLRKENKDILFALTRMDLDKVFERRPVSKNNVEFEFLTTEKMQERKDRTLQKAMRSLQMPPVVMAEDDSTQEISNDPAITDFSEAKIVITDITFGVSNRDRIVLVRNTNGLLETAPPDVKKRMSQIYFPMEGRKLTTPMLFIDKYLQKALDDQRYEYVLDRACIQYEPFEKEYHRIVSVTYQHLNSTKNFHSLRSTRHFGPLAFFLAWHKTINNLLIDMMQRDLLVNAVQTICLMYNIHEIPYDNNVSDAIAQATAKDPGNTNDDSDNIRQIVNNVVGKSARDVKTDELCLNFIADYVNSRTSHQDEIKAVLEACKRKTAQQRELLDNVLKTHGITEANLD